MYDVCLNLHVLSSRTPDEIAAAVDVPSRRQVSHSPHKKMTGVFRLPVIRLSGVLFNQRRTTFKAASPSLKFENRGSDIRPHMHIIIFSFAITAVETIVLLLCV